MNEARAELVRHLHKVDGLPAETIVSAMERWLERREAAQVERLRSLLRLMHSAEADFGDPHPACNNSR